MRMRFLCLIIAAFLLFPASSPWEGAAAVAPAGVIPETGRYVATNSFPLHTIVEIRNIENNRSTHAIVVKGLDSPGLLALVSLEVAQIIGMRSGSISRVRMLQPSDPMAYLRFTEGLSPFNLPENYISEEELLAQLYGDDTYIPPSAAETAQLPSQSHSVPLVPPSVPGAVIERGYIVDEPEWGGSGRLSIVDIPEYNITPLTPFPEYELAGSETFTLPETSLTDVPVIAEAKEPVVEEPVIPESPAEIELAHEPEAEPETELVYEPELEPETELAYEPEIQIIEEPVFIANNDRDEIIKDVPQRYEETSLSEIVKDVPLYNPEEQHEGIDKEAPIYMTELPRDEVIKDVSERVEHQSVEYVAQEKPVEETTPTDSEYIASEEPPVEGEYVAEQPPVEDQGERQTETTYRLVQTDEQPPPSTLYGIDMNEIIPGITETAGSAPSIPMSVIVTAPVTPAVTQAAADQSFSVQTITRLDYGQYYVQLAALPRDQVENTIKSIDRRYNPVVLREADNLYRVLIGPLNQGESAAILQRFRTIGFSDAFVRRAN